MWHAAYDVEDVRHSVEHAGWTFGYADGWGTESVAEFHELVASALAFPDYYGRNLDALWDCLTDLVEPTVLLWDGWGPLAHAEPERFDKVAEGPARPERRAPAVLRAHARRGPRRRRPVLGLSDRLTRPGG